ncbi:MAG: SH3 domain-containing protein [Chloroflexota bacterium]
MRNNKLSPSTWVLILPVILALTSVGCGLSGLMSREPAEPVGRPTRTPLPTFTPTAVGAAFVDIPSATPTQEIVESSATPLPAAGQAAAEPSSPLPTPEPSPTPPPANEAVTVTLMQDMNVRTGPGTNYPIAGPGPAGESAKVLGRNADSSWLQVEYPLTADGTGWVYAKLVQVNGNPETVEVVQVAAPPVVQAQPAEQAEAPPPAPEAPKYQFTPTGWHASENAAIVQFKGRLKDEAGNLVNGFSVLVDNGAFSVLSHPAGASRWYPDKGDGEWDVVMPNLFDAQGWWKLTVVTYDCPGFFDAGFNAQCKQFTRLSEDVKIEVRTPEESIINADWTCHWDCNKGLYVDAYRR